MEFTPAEASVLNRYCTNLEGRVFALRNLPDVVKGALFSRYSRTEKSLRRVLLDEFVNAPEMGFEAVAGPASGPDLVAARRAEEFYERVLVGYGDDSVAELAGAHLACERISMLAAKALEDSRIGISPLEKSTRYVRFDRPGPDGSFLYHRGPELDHPDYAPAMDGLFSAYSEMVGPLTERVREIHPMQEGETERGWKSATRAKALDLLRGLLPAGALTNAGLFGNGRAFEYLVTKLAASELPECRRLAVEVHRELSVVIPAFLRRALDDRHGRPAAERIERAREDLSRLAPSGPPRVEPASVRLLEHDPAAERKVLAAALFGRSNLPLDALPGEVDAGLVLDAAVGERSNRRQRVPRAFELAGYTFEVVADFGAYRDLHRHRMLSQDRQLLGTDLGYDVPAGLFELGFGDAYRKAVEAAAGAQRRMAPGVGPALAQYAVPMCYRLRWYMRLNLREVVHLCELRTTPQGHQDYRRLAHEMFRRVEEVHPRLARYARFVDMGPGVVLERRRSEQRIDQKLGRLRG